QALSIAFGAVGVLTNIVLVLIGAIYLALQPQLYSKGVALLFPKSEGPRVAAALSACAVSLRKYLLGQLFTMTIIGAMVTVGLFIVGVPSASALGL
ncbi:AI-2E family transporter, partial [Klebsiella pneumoniae]|nr:AI-2E family transporter [Klebsiella pneumoniae]